MTDQPTQPVAKALTAEEERDWREVVAASALDKTAPADGGSDDGKRPWRWGWVVTMRAGWLERFWIAVAHRLPRRLAYWAYIRVAASATTNEYRTRTPHEVSVIEALEAWKP